MKHWLKRIFWVGTAVVIISIIGLEVASRTCNCSAQVDPDFRRIKVCEQGETYNSSEQAALDLMRSERTRGLDIPKETYREKMDALVKEVDTNLLGPANGVVCGKAYVRNSLPLQAKLFVKRHEFEHLMQELPMENKEASANMAAAKEYPFGLLQTIVVSLMIAKAGLSWGCFLISSWHIFKIYFLGIGD